MSENGAPMPQKKKSTKMSAEHKAALAQGRNEARCIRLYLEALEAHKPKRGRKRTPDSIAKRLEAIAAALPDAEPVNRLHLVQERLCYKGGNLGVNSRPRVRGGVHGFGEGFEEFPRGFGGNGGRGRRSGSRREGGGAGKQLLKTGGVSVSLFGGCGAGGGGAGVLASGRRPPQTRLAALWEVSRPGRRSPFDLGRSHENRPLFYGRSRAVVLGVRVAPLGVYI